MQKAVFILTTAAMVGLGQRALADEIVGYFRDGQYRTIDTSTGAVTPLAPAPGGTAEGIFAIDPSARIAYRIEEGTERIIFATDLIAKTTQNVQIIGAEDRLQAFAAFDGKLVGQFSGPGGGSLRSIDPFNGATTAIADAPQPTPHRSLSIDPSSGIAVRITDLLAQTIEVIDLVSGETRSLTLDEYVFKIDVYGGRAIGYFGGRTYREIDLETGALTVLANAPPGIQNLLFSIDPVANAAYSVTDIRGRQLARTDLNTGFTTFVTAGDTSELWGIDAHGLDPLPPRFLQPITDITRGENGMVLTIPLVTGRRVGIEDSADLSPGSWLDLGNTFRFGQSGRFLDPDPIRKAHRNGYYRAFLRPER